MVEKLIVMVPHDATNIFKPNSQLKNNGPIVSLRLGTMLWHCWA